MLPIDFCPPQLWISMNSERLWWIPTCHCSLAICCKLGPNFYCYAKKPIIIITEVAQPIRGITTHIMFLKINNKVKIMKMKTPNKKRAHQYWHHSDFQDVRLTPFHENNRGLALSEKSMHQPIVDRTCLCAIS